MPFVELLAHPLAQLVTLALLHFLWQGTAIAVLLIAVVDVGKIRSLQSRYNCSLAALARMIVVPLARRHHANSRDTLSMPSHSPRRCQSSTRIFLGTLCLLGVPVSLTAQDYKSYSDAMRAAAPLMRDRQYAAAQAPLEAALGLATDGRDRLRAYQALVPAYRLLPQPDKMYEAQEFVIRHTDRRTGRSLAAGELASFLHQRGLTDAAVGRYGAVLKNDPDEIAAVTILAAIYARTKRDAAKAAEFAERQTALDKKLASAEAKRLESDASGAPRTAAAIYKDAAAAWIEAGDNARAVAAVKKSLASPPEARNDQLVYFWRRGLGDALLAAGESADAIPQFEAALKVVAIEGYRKDTEKQLAAAREAAQKK